MTTGGISDDFVLPTLREDLRIERSVPLASGAPSWVIYDPMRHRYFQVGRRVIDILSGWGAGTVGALKETIARQKGVIVEPGELKNLIGFLFANELTALPMSGRSEEFAARADKARRKGLLSLAKAYLFFRIPLVRPDRFLDRTLPFVRIFFSPAFVLMVIIAGCLGLALAARQLDAFLSYAGNVISLEGAGAYAVAIVIVKFFHELGHAYQAKLRGVTVPSIGIAFMVMFPLLYTDVSDAWRTRSRRDKLMIDAGGVLVELCLAAIATLLWVFLPDGPMRMIAFSVATTSWVLSLFVNLNPFMRFDGYYFLSDATGLQNLQPRSFALLRWRIRELLFGLGHAPPERVSRGTRRFMVVYAAMTAIYRFFLFIGIALLVYQLFFKALGILLFVIEIVFFIALPIVREIAVWIRMRAEIAKSPRAWITAGLSALLLGFFFWPMPVTVHAPAVLGYGEEVEVFPASGGKIVDVDLENGRVLKKGDLLFTIASPELDSQIEMTERRKELLDLRMARTVADLDERASRRILERERAALSDQLDGLLQERDALTVVARIDGVVVDVSPDAEAGVWVGREHRLARIVDPAALRLRGYLAEHDLARVASGTKGVFVPDDPTQATLSTELTSIARFAAEQLSQEYLSSENGGSIPMEAPRNQSDIARPHGSWFAISASVTNMATQPLANAQRGKIVMEGRAESWAYRFALQVARVLVREYGA